MLMLEDTVEIIYAQRWLAQAEKRFQFFAMFNAVMFKDVFAHAYAIRHSRNHAL